MDDEFQVSDEDVKVHVDLVLLWMMHYGGFSKETSVKKLHEAKLIYTESGEYNKYFLHDNTFANF